MIMRPIRKAKTTEFLVVTTQRRFDSIESVGLWAIQRTINDLLTIKVSNKISDFNPSSATELSIPNHSLCGTIILYLAVSVSRVPGTHSSRFQFLRVFSSENVKVYR